MKDGTVEPWLEYTKRTLSKASHAVKQFGTQASTYMQNEQVKWAQHCVRFGLEGKPPHLLKPILMFRCKRWWNFQMLYNQLNWDPIFHSGRGRPYSWEDRLPTNWALEWSKPAFLAKYRQSSSN